jgi:hypothetical protein
VTDLAHETECQRVRSELLRPDVSLTCRVTGSTIRRGQQRRAERVIWVSSVLDTNVFVPDVWMSLDELAEHDDARLAVEIVYFYVMRLEQVTRA